MSNLSKAQPEQIERMKLDACSTFGPLILREALHRLCQTHGAGCLDGFERAMVDRIEAYQGEIQNLNDVKEFAIEQLYAAIKDARSYPDNKQPLEQIEARRTKGRSEDPSTLEEQLDEGLMDSFPASDPPAVVSTTISRKSPKDGDSAEQLRRKREAQAMSR